MVLGDGFCKFSTRWVAFSIDTDDLQSEHLFVRGGGRGESQFQSEGERRKKDLEEK